MSLVGSLEDLGLGDILQIISLSGKSGVLLLRADRGEGQVMFEDGLLRAAFAKGGATNLWELLAAAESIAKSDLDAAWREARDVGRPLAELLVDRGLLDADTIDQLRRDNIESSVYEMFTWETGEFSFEVRRLSASDGDDLFVEPGMNPQFLALEGTRIADERRHEAALSDDALPVGEPEEELDDEPVFAEWIPDDEAEDAEPLLAAETIAEPEPRAVTAPAMEEACALEASPVQEDSRTELPAAAAPVACPLPPVIVVDPSLPVLEWAKEALAASFPAVHVFQHSDLGIHRIRQYLARAEVPLVILAEDAPQDPISGARDPFEIIARLKRQSARMPVLLLCPTDASPPKRREGRPDGLVMKPSPTELADQREFEARQAHAARLRERVLAILGVVDEPAEGPDNSESLARLKEVTARIHSPGARGEVLPEVLRFAAQVFSRVALFMVRGDAAIGIAQAGLQKAGGPDEAGLRTVHVGSQEPEWFRAVIESGSSVTAAPQGEGDQRLGVMLGNDLPEQAFVAPIRAGGQIVALLYGDMLPARQLVGPTDALEHVLEAAGVALDRAVEHRSVEDGGPSAPPAAG